MGILHAQKVWVVERDKTEKPYGVAGVAFIATYGSAVIVYPFPEECEDLYDIMHDCIVETRENDGCGILVYPIKDCYGSREEAYVEMRDEIEKTKNK